MTREKIISAADLLFYQQGYECTTFSQVADRLNISKGNFYHHFKTKDEILQAVIQKRIRDTKQLLQQWEAGSKCAYDRILKFIQILTVNYDKIEAFGCPVGTLCMELGKLDHKNQDEAKELFSIFRYWLIKQFILLGYKEEADRLALHLLARSQGVATLSQAFKDKEFVEYEVQQMFDWLEQFQ